MESGTAIQYARDDDQVDSAVSAVMRRLAEQGATNHITLDMLTKRLTPIMREASPLAEVKQADAVPARADSALVVALNDLGTNMLEQEKRMTELLDRLQV